MNTKWCIIEPRIGGKYQAQPGPKKVQPGPVHCIKIQARPGDWKAQTGLILFLGRLLTQTKTQWAVICMLNIINSPTGEARVRSGDGVIDSLHLQGRQKGWCGREGEGCGPQKRCMWASRPTCWPARHSPVTTRPGPMVFQNYTARPGPNTALVHNTWIIKVNSNLSVYKCLCKISAVFLHWVVYLVFAHTVFL